MRIAQVTEVELHSCPLTGQLIAVLKIATKHEVLYDDLIADKSALQLVGRKILISNGRIALDENGRVVTVDSHLRGEILESLVPHKVSTKIGEILSKLQNDKQRAELTIIRNKYALGMISEVEFVELCEELMRSFTINNI